MINILGDGLFGISLYGKVILEGIKLYEFGEMVQGVKLMSLKKVKMVSGC